MPTEIEEIRDALAELLAERRKPKRPHDSRPLLNFRLEPQEMLAIDAACTQRGLCRSDLIRFALNQVLGTDFRICRPVPAGFVGRRNRKKSERFHDQKTSVPLRDASDARQAAGRVISARHEYRQILAEQGAAVAHTAHNLGEMMTDSPGPLLSGKPSR
jgi:hypothetical protein